MFSILRLLFRICLSILGILLISLLVLISILTLKADWRTNYVQHIINKAGAEYLPEPIRLKSVWMDSQLKLHIRNLEFPIRGEKKVVYFVAEEIHSRNSILNALKNEGSQMDLKGIKPLGSQNKGLSGTLTIRARPSPIFDLQGTIEELNLSEFSQLYPSNFEGAYGKIRGSYHFRLDNQGEPLLAVHASVDSPGGTLQARFFNVLNAYLPRDVKRKTTSISAQDLVGFERADMDFELIQSDKARTFLFLAIPEYNLHLNLKIDMKLDEKKALTKLAELAGFIRVE